MTTDNDAFRALIQFPHGGRLYYILQCLAPLFDGDTLWYDWMPDDTLKAFGFASDAYAEAERLRRLNVPRNASDWRVVAVAELRQVLDAQMDEEGES